MAAAFHTSEQASQQLAGAWLMRAGFVTYGLGTLAAAAMDWGTRPLVRLALTVFGLGLIAAAVWSNASIFPEAVSDMREDLIHSLASGVAGTAFAFACAARIFAPFGLMRDLLAWTGLAASVARPDRKAALGQSRHLVRHTCTGCLVIHRSSPGGDILRFLLRTKKVSGNGQVDAERPRANQYSSSTHRPSSISSAFLFFQDCADPATFPNSASSASRIGSRPATYTCVCSSDSMFQIS